MGECEAILDALGFRGGACEAVSNVSNVDHLHSPPRLHVFLGCIQVNPRAKEVLVMDKSMVYHTSLVFECRRMRQHT